MAVELWVDKFRPLSIDQYVWRDNLQKKKVEEWIAGKALPHILLSGVQGTGKTSLALLMLKLLGIPKSDILKINASRDRKIEDIQSKVVNFVGTWAFNPTGIKYVLLDEADKMSPLAQGLLRGEMETYVDVCRFILTCNYPQKIIPALHSRLQGFTFSALDQEQFLARLIHVLTVEGVQYTDDVLMKLYEQTYPDLRKCINMAQQSVHAGVLDMPPDEDAAGTKDYLLGVVDLFNEKRFLEARKLIVAQAQVEEYTDIFRFFYKNLQLWGDTEDQKDQALLAIRRGLVNHALVADPEINLAATMVELSLVAKGTA